MTVRAILELKGRDVVTITPEATIAEAAELMGGRRIGAVVVTAPGGAIAGILSERDIVRAIGVHGAAALKNSVSQVMTRSVETCTELQTVNELLEIMTARRFRHLPVAEGGRLVGIVSIGDVVKQRIEDVEREADEIKQYIATG